MAQVQYQANHSNCYNYYIYSWVNIVNPGHNYMLQVIITGLLAISHSFLGLGV